MHTILGQKMLQMDFIYYLEQFKMKKSQDSKIVIEIPS